MSDPARLRLFQLVSPALPVGAFSYSEGLEVLLQTGMYCGLPAAVDAFRVMREAFGESDA